MEENEVHLTTSRRRWNAVIVAGRTRSIILKMNHVRQSTDIHLKQIEFVPNAHY